MKNTRHSFWRYSWIWLLAALLVERAHAPFVGGAAAELVKLKAIPQKKPHTAIPRLPTSGPDPDPDDIRMRLKELESRGQPDYWGWVGLDPVAPTEGNNSISLFDSAPPDAADFAGSPNFAFSDVESPGGYQAAASNRLTNSTQITPVLHHATPIVQDGVVRNSSPATVPEPAAATVLLYGLFPCISRRRH